MSRERNVVNYYVLCNRLKNVIRTGWLDWNVQRERIESVAEHIFGVQMLAIAMHSEYQYDLDIVKVVFMLAIHELGETVIGDLTQFQISKAEKEKLEHEAVHKILEGLLDGETIDKAWTLGTGSPKGPFKIIDTIGLNTAYEVVLMYVKIPSFLAPYNFKGMEKLLKKYIDEGKLGMSSGEGFYKYK